VEALGDAIVKEDTRLESTRLCRVQVRSDQSAMSGNCLKEEEMFRFYGACPFLAVQRNQFQSSKDNKLWIFFISFYSLFDILLPRADSRCI
jgi:hypothetical protein